jgi:hypothetical protein
MVVIMQNRKLMLCFIAAFLILQIAGLGAQTLRVRSFAEPSSIGRNEDATYTIEVTGDKGFKLTAPKLPELADFSLRNVVTSSASNYSFINGNVSESVTRSFIYRLVPKRTGSLRIPAFIITINGKNYSTQLVTVRVLEKAYAGNPQQGNPYGFGQAMPFMMQNPFDVNLGFEPIGDMSIIATPDKRSVYLGEPLLVTYRLYTTQPISSLELKDEKDFGGYGKEVYSETTRLNFETVKFKNQRYRMAILKTLAISPNRAGEIELPQLTADVQMGTMGLYSKTLQSEPAKIMVNNLPATGKPLDYSGAVGRFKVTDKLSKNTIRLGEALEYKLIINGKGNFNQFSNPAYPEQQDFRIASPLTDDQIQAGASGTRTINYLLIPKREGTFTLPGVDFNWFDPISGSYQGFHSNSVTVIIKPGNVLTFISNVFQKENIKVLSSFNPKQGYTSQPILAGSTLYWLLVVFVLLSLLPSWWIASNKKLKHIDPDLAAQKGSARVLKKYFKQAKQAAEAGSQDFYPKAEQGLMKYLSDKYHISHRYSTAEKIYQLRLKGLDEELIESLEGFLKHCQEARFMPGGFNELTLFSDLEDLNKVIKSFIKLSDKTMKLKW